MEAEEFRSTTKTDDYVELEAMEQDHDIIKGINEGLREEVLESGAVDSKEIKEKNIKQDGDRRTRISKTGPKAEAKELLPKENNNIWRL